ncbi:hypothetical protein PT974_00289 [Cladobotryum mycophilum]|uniref:Uncharacterized protein n=1 Tax=Cladobotryum mycophilum TaxID=491253 RepID=A0ABR0T1A0_9HYPO
MSSWAKDDVIALTTLLVTIVLAPVAWLVKTMRKNRTQGIPRDSIEMRYELEA